MFVSLGVEAKVHGAPLLFDPEQGETIIAPAGEGKGYWAGAASALYDAESDRFYLYYRVRKPRPVRGGECYIAESTDGVHFATIWSATKEDFGSPSVERFCLTRALDGAWLLYPSYVDPEDNRWRIDVIEAARPDSFDPTQSRTLLTAGDIGAEGVKDPWVMVVNGLYYMLVSYAVKLEEMPKREEERKHATADVYNTGLTLSSTGLATSGDGRSYHWEGDVFAPRPGAWDAYAARLGCLVATEQGWVGYYDGSSSVQGNYEERTGLVQSWDLARFYRLSGDGPMLVSANASQSLRYVDAVVLEDVIYFYYEYCRPDGSHELRLNRVDRR